MTRKAPTLREKLAAALLQLNPDIREWAKTQTPEAIISTFHCDHYPVPHAEGGTNHPTNLEMRLIPDHHEKTRKVDVPAIARSKRLTKAHEAFQARILAKTGQGQPEAPPRANTWRSRPMAGTKASGIKLKFGGKSERR